MRHRSRPPRSPRCMRHACRDGEEVVVKVLRPDMRALIERDLEVLHALAELAQRYWPEGRRLRPREVVAEYQKTVLDELDLMREAANASQLKRNFAGSDAAVRAGGLLGPLPQRRHGDGAHPRRADQRPGGAARRGHQHRAAGRERRAHLLHPGVPPQLLPRRHAPGQHLRDRRRSAAAALRGGGFRHRRHARSARPALPGGEFPRGVRPRLPARRAAAPASPAGCRPARASTRWSPRCAPYASRSSTGR